MPAAPTAFFQQPQQLVLAGAHGTGLPARCAGTQQSIMSQLQQSQQPWPAGVVGTGMPAPGLPPQQATSNFTLSTASLPAHHPKPFISRPSPVPTSLRRQIIDGNYIDLTLLILASLHQPPADRFIEGYEGCPHYKVRAPSRTRELTPTEFAYAFSLYRDVLCSEFPSRRNKLDDYLSIILNLALRFGGNGFYQYHTHFASEAAARLSQSNEATYWGTLDNEICCRIFAACAALTCSLCGAPSHPASSCFIPTHTEPRQSQTRVSAFSRLSSAAPPATVTPKQVSSAPSVIFPITNGIDKKGRLIGTVSLFSTTTN